jgi:hypothetical protein
MSTPVGTSAVPVATTSLDAPPAPASAGSSEECGTPARTGPHPPFTDVLSEHMERSPHDPTDGRGPSRRATPASAKGARPSTAHGDHVTRMAASTPAGPAVPAAATGTPERTSPPSTRAPLWDRAPTPDPAPGSDPVAPSEADPRRAATPSAAATATEHPTDPSRAGGGAVVASGSSATGGDEAGTVRSDGPIGSEIRSAAGSPVGISATSPGRAMAVGGRPASDRAPSGPATAALVPATARPTGGGRAGPPVPRPGDGSLDLAEARPPTGSPSTPSPAAGSTAKVEGPSATSTAASVAEQFSDSLDVDGLAGSISRPLSDGNGNYTVVVAMHPPELGRLQAVMALTGDELQVSITPQSRAGHDALATAVDALRDQLARGGVNVTVTLRDPGSQSEGDDGHAPPTSSGNSDAPGDTVPAPTGSGPLTGQIHLVL